MQDTPVTATGTERPASSMTAPATAAPSAPPKSTALTRQGDAMNPLTVTGDDKAALTDAQRQQIAIRKNANIVTAKLAGTSWGKGMDDETRRAVADWGQRNGVDVTTEIHVLGGNIYLNAQFYLNRLVGLVQRGLVLDYRQEFIQPDPRLDAIVNEKIPGDLPEDLKPLALEDRRYAFEERSRRRRLRIEHGAPEVPPAGIPAEHFAVAVTTLTLAAMPNSPIRGVKWAPHGPKDKDPVGAAYPQETALTRSSRRALKQCVTHIPELARWVDGSEDDAAASIAVAIREHDARRTQLERVGADRPRIGAQSTAQADYLQPSTDREDVTTIRGPVAVTPKPAADPYHRHASDAAFTSGASDAPTPSPAVAEALPDPPPSLEEQLGPIGSSQHPDDDTDDLELLTDAERLEAAEHARRRAAK